MVRTKSGLLGIALAASVTFGACDDGDDVLTPPVARTFRVTLENVAEAYIFPASGLFDTPAGAAAPGPLLPGGVYEFSFSAPPGARLSFATMMVQSNDLFYAPSGDGIALWNADGSQVIGDVTSQVRLWDAGTEADEEPGLGPNQAPRQSAGDTGPADPNNVVRAADDTFGNLVPVESVVRVTLSSAGPYSWTARIQNVSTASTLTTSDGGAHPVPLAPGAFVVHSNPNPLFTVGQPDAGDGLEGVAEDGSATALGQSLAARTGVTGVLSPGVWAVHTVPSVLFRAGQTDSGRGLEAIAEDGDPTAMAGSLAADASVLASGAFNTPEGASAPAPAFPGDSYSFEIVAEEGQRLSFATMYVQSNDLFFAPAEAGIDLFPGGTALSGDATGMVLLWDAGTEANQAPGIGPDQAPRQPGANIGAAENGAVRQVDDGFQYGPVSATLRVTVTPIG